LLPNEAVRDSFVIDSLMQHLSFGHGGSASDLFPAIIKL
jgi:hypothetical protein